LRGAERVGKKGKIAELLGLDLDYPGIKAMAIIAGLLVCVETSLPDEHILFGEGEPIAMRPWT
jgi:hypothetical protein